MKRVSSILLLLLVGSLAASDRLAVAQARDTVNRGHPRVRATMVDASTSIDGRLDEAVWQQAPPITGFKQFAPNEGAPATQRTVVRVLHGTDNLYIGAMLYDDHPGRIAQTLGRRDEYNRADWFVAAIDSYFNQRTAYIFGVNAAGVQYDAIQRGGGGGPGGGPGDNSWDAVWYSDVRITPEGWALEMRIPYSMLRFAEAPVQTWGIHFTRRIPRLGEVSEWPLIPRTQRTNLVAQFGLLTGIAGIDPKRNLQIRPYLVTRLHTAESAEEPGALAMDGSFDLGGDVKVGLGPNITLDATINPDFGQVEADPAVLNLTAFETFFEERRPFFLEGIQIYEFSIGPGELLYTRRIGAAAPIVGAMKLSGRTASGLSFGVLGATTGENFSPSRYYGVLRMRQQIGAYSSLGGILTGFDAPAAAAERRRSLVGGADWDLRFLGNRYGVEGFAAFTHRRGPMLDQGAQTGMFCQIDDFCKHFEPVFEEHLLASGRVRRRRRPRLALSEIMTIIVHFHRTSYRTFKAYYTQHVMVHLKQHFPRLVSYNRFVELMPRALVPLACYLSSRRGDATGIAFVDSTPLAVCRNQRIKQHRVFKGVARRGKTSMGWFYGFKLHLIVNDWGELLAFRLTPGNVDDRKPVPGMTRQVQDLFGKLFGDRGYKQKFLLPGGSTMRSGRASS